MNVKKHWILLIILFFSAGVFGQQMFQHLLGINAYPDFTWTGLGPNTNWTTATNWTGNTAPGLNDTAHFMAGACTTSCSPIINASISVGGIDIRSSYTGTITQSPGFTVSVGTSGWSQSGGTFLGSNAAITVSGNFTLTSGTFTSTSAQFTVDGGDFLNSGTFNANAGTLNLACTYGKTCLVTPGASIYRDVIFSGLYGAYNLGGATMTVAGNLSAGDRWGPSERGQPINNGTINLSGNYTVINAGYRGSAEIVLKGNPAGQFVYGLSGYAMPGLRIAAGANPVTLVGEVNTTNSFTMTSASSLTVTGSTLNMYCYYGQTCTITPNTFHYNNVTFAGAYTTFTLGGATMLIDGDLTIGDLYGGGYTSQPINSGTLTVLGNILINNSGYRGSVVLNPIGAANRTFTVQPSVGVPEGNMVFNKTTSSVLTLSGNLTLGGTGQNLDVTSGIFNLAGNNLTVNNQLTVGANGKIICNGGTVTATSYSILGELSCGSSIGITWTGATGNHLWNDAGNWTNGTIPGAGDIAIFNSICSGANCNATMNVAVNVRGVLILSSYPGTITQGAGNAVTVGSGGWSQAAGTFAGAAAAITMTGDLNLTGGTFTSTSGTMQLTQALTFGGSSVFNANAGTLVLSGAYSVVNALTPGTAAFNIVSFSGNFSVYNLTGTMTINGTLTFNDTDAGSGSINGGTILANGNVNFANYGKVGTVLLKITGSGNQTVTGTASARIPSLEVASTGGTVSFSGTLLFNQNYTYTSGAVNSGTSAFVFNAPYLSAKTITPGTVAYNDVTFTGFNSFYNLVGTMTINGTLTLNDTDSGAGAINGGTLLANGNVNFGNYGKVGTVLLKISGSGNQTVTGVSTARTPNIEVASTGGIVSFAGTVLFENNYTYTSGTVNTGTSIFIFNAPYNTLKTITPGIVAYNDVTFTGGYSLYSLVGSMKVNGTLTLNDTDSGSGSINGGTLLANGNVNFGNYGKSGTVLLKISGSGNQAISGVSNARIPSLEVASTGGTVSFSGTLLFNQNYTFTSGVVNTGTSLFVFNAPYNSAKTITPGTVAYNDVTYTGSYSLYNLVGTMIVNGTLTLNDTDSGAGAINGGTLLANGNVILANYGKLGSTTLNLSGSTSTNLTSTSSARIPTGSVTVSKTGGASVIMLSDVAVNNTSQNLTVSSGTLNLGGFSLVVNSVLTVGSGAVLKCNGGIFSDGSLVNNGTINCPGFPTYDYNWTGAGGNSNWNTAANWQLGVIPTSSDVAVFQDTYCGANCNATINVSSSVKGLITYSPYSGTITQAAGNTLTIGDRGWNQAAGTFAGGNSAINLNGVYTQTGGVFTNTSGTFTVTGFTDTTMTVFNKTGGTFNHNSGSVAFVGRTQGFVNPVYTVGGSAPINFYKLSLDNGYAASGSAVSFSSTQPLNVANDFTFQGTASAAYLNSATINASGNIFALSGAQGGNANLNIVGNSAQTYTTVGSGTFPNLVLNTTGSLSAAAAVTTLTANSLNIQQGTLNAPSGSLTLAGLNDTSMTLFAKTGGTFNANGGTVVMTGGTVGYSSPVYSVTGPSTIAFNNLTFDDVTSTVGSAATFSAVPALNVAGNLTVKATVGYTRLNSATINSSGNIYALAGAIGGTANINVVGNTAQTYTGSATGTLPNLIVNTTGSLSPAAGVTLLAANSLAVQQGTFTAPSGTLTLTGVNDTSMTLFNQTGGIFAHNNGTVLMTGGGAGYTTNVYTVSASAPLNFYNLTFDDVYNSVGASVSFSSSQVLNVAGDFVLKGTAGNASLNSATVNVSGNASFLTNSNGGSATITMTGTAAQTITQTAAVKIPGSVFTVNKSSGVVNLASNVSLGVANQDLAITSGTLNMSGFSLNVNRNVSNLGVLQRGSSPACGSLTYGGTYTGAAAVCP